MRIPVAHDFICSWCWIAVHQIRALRQELGVEFEYRAYELFPEGMDYPEPAPKAEAASDRPKTPTRQQLAMAAAGLSKPTNVGPRVRTRMAHQAIGFAAAEGKADSMFERLYEAYWTEGADIGSLDVICGLAEGIVADTGDLRSAIERGDFSQDIVPFDDAAYESGVYNVPTFWIGGERYAEQPLVVLRQAILDARAAAK